MIRPESGAETDAALLERVRGRDDTAMATLYDKYNRLVFTVALRVLGDRQAAEDLLQEVFMRVWRNPNMNVPPAGMAAWFVVVARNRAIDVIRQRRDFVDAQSVAIEAELSTRPAFEQKRLVQQAREALQLMPEEQRATLEMAFFEGLTHTEIAERTGTPLGTIKTRIRTAVGSLRKVMAA
jgi:RNA polymerase sigma-70 factor, ECF subfamily